ncbi:MAG: hypothetical protein KAW39_04265 [Thermoplasmata archaeon]|nr:hypothetical protein [Thermoplasmata archaeon]
MRKERRAAGGAVIALPTGIFLVLLHQVTSSMLSEQADTGHSEWEQLGEMFSGLSQLFLPLALLVLALGCVSLGYWIYLRGQRKRMSATVRRPKWK